MAGHNPCCQEEDAQDAEGVVSDVVCQVSIRQLEEARQEAQDQEQQRHCAATTHAAPVQPKIQIYAANV
jgi:hypothetical protein